MTTPRSDFTPADIRRLHAMKNMLTERGLACATLAACGSIRGRQRLPHPEPEFEPEGNSHD
ncbi:hypothetical protein [Bradyrhizobium sp. JYMT SZCCT0428]|uniref:hypothetical protein n=1 Tax=Bradyrhizobium sp. JYMT SZCCT0428 TaxID=2807673 RepID=UPI001BA82C0B|nr:hypothetical protein [Bradyrhizobium sp. JYMT SZCCT0428]MBR1154278.1 hypothetical protein [Bradyrhizobium sp. JYMT SZCCT0428]